MNYELLTTAYLFPIFRWFKQIMNNSEFENFTEKTKAREELHIIYKTIKLMKDIETGNQYDHPSYEGDIKYLIDAMQTVGITRSNSLSPNVKLKSIFSRIELDHEFEANLYYPMSPLSVGAIFPESSATISKQELEKHQDEFLTALLREFESTVADSNTLLVRVQRVVEHYAWCIQSGIDGYEEIPLSEICKQLCSLTAVFLVQQSSQNVVLAVGDISGIQRYIFDVAQTGASGVAKRLRARSFYLGVMSDIISHKLLHTFNLPLVNIIMSSGGKFYILLPSGQLARNELQQFQLNLDNWLLERYHGELVCNLAYVEAEIAELNSIDHVIEQLNDRLQKRKSNQLSSALIKNNQWDEGAFLRNSHNPLQRCTYCKKNTASSRGLCDICIADEIIGRDLASAKYITFLKGDQPNIKGYEVLEDYYIEVNKELNQRKDDDIYLVYELNGLLGSENTDYPLLTKYMANYIPVADQTMSIVSEGNQEAEEKVWEGHPLPFSLIADRATGQKQLACLKADVDLLGSVFTLGLKKDESFISLLQVSTLSKMIELFFSGWINNQMEDKYTNIYTVFSGGDDLFLIGAWHEIILFAKEIRKSFVKFTGNNPNITLSAGITINKTQVPVVRQAEWTEAELEQAKEQTSFERPDGRNQISLFGMPMTWDRFEIFWNDAVYLGSLWNERKITSAFLYRLLEYAEMYGQYKEGDLQGLKFYPRLSYDLARNFISESSTEAKLWARRFLVLDVEDHPLEMAKPLIRLSRMFRTNLDH